MGSLSPPGVVCQGGWQYPTKVAKLNHHGPFAFLVRPIIDSPREAGHHNYLEDPEIVQDICMSYETRFRRRHLRERFRAATRPCVVKFRSEKARDDVLEAALMYLHSALTDQPLSGETNTNYSGMGEAVLRQDILKVEWI
jgi:hypothetical protein